MSNISPLTLSLRERVKHLERLVRDYYCAALIGKQMEDPTAADVENYEAMIDGLQERAIDAIDIDSIDDARMNAENILAKE